MKCLLLHRLVLSVYSMCLFTVELQPTSLLLPTRRLFSKCSRLHDRGAPDQEKKRRAEGYYNYFFVKSIVLITELFPLIFDYKS